MGMLMILISVSVVVHLVFVCQQLPLLHKEVVVYVELNEFFGLFSCLCLDGFEFVFNLLLEILVGLV